MIVKAMTPGYFGLLVCLAVLGCEQAEIRGCDRVNGVTQNLWELEYTVQVPSNCPVPLGVVGEDKRAGAEILDYAPFDFLFGEVYVQSSDEFSRGYDIITFSESGTYALL